ncbi:MAG TPA: hypothetical protein VFC90_08425 [Planctomycetota bacterium]|nr:hypothetical protein [Planctomycetota bacterium]
MGRSGILSVIVLALAGLSAQDPRKETKVDPKKVNEAIDKGAAFLLKEYENGINNRSWTSPVELVVLTLNHANVKADNPVFEKCLKSMLEAKLEYTYRVSLQAMALHRLDAKKHQDRIAECAQWLVDTQCFEGEWGYPGTLADERSNPKPVTVEPPKKEIPKGAPPGTEAQWNIRRKVRPDPKIKGDQSNAQFALLGLRACQESGVEIPKETWGAARKFMLYTQRPDGGWGYYFGDRKDKTSYGSLTLAGIAAVAICEYYLGTKEPLKVASIQRGVGWMARRLDYSENPLVTSSNVIDPRAWHYYYLYSIERTGIILNTEKFGDREWYPGGAQWLIKNQQPAGSWSTGVRLQWVAAGSMVTPDTCLAILFLTRSTPPLVETGQKKKPEDPPEK